MKDCFLGIDIGTSNIKSVLFNREGFPVGMGSVECSISSTENGRAEMDPDKVIDAVFQAVRRCMDSCGLMASNLTGIGLSSHMHSILAVDRDGRPLTQLILWTDTRAKEEADFIGQNFEVADLYKKTGCRVQHPMYPLSKILWLRNHDRKVFDSSYKFITIKEYLIFRLFGTYLVDCSLASCQGYYNITEQRWDADILQKILEIDESRLSTVVECTYSLVGMDPQCADRMGIDSRTPVVVGSGDGLLANIGCGIFGGDSLSSTVGTSGAIRKTVNAPFFSPGQQTWCYSFSKDLWIAGGAMNNGGLTLKWIRDNFESSPSGSVAGIYKKFDDLASQVNPGSDGLLFMPFLTGERSPDWNADVRGVVYGLSYMHGRSHLLRAAMEGVMYRLYSIYEVMTSSHAEPRRIIANGGYTKSDLWLQIQADVFNKEILVSGVSDASALGAAYLCMLSLGALSHMGEGLPGIRTVKEFEPDPSRHEVYAKAYEHYQEIYYKLYPQSN